MYSTDGPRLLAADEFDELAELQNRHFNFERGGMEARYPHSYDRSKPDRHAVISVDDTIVSHAAAIPQPLEVGVDGELECWGIAGVVTAKRYRGNGFMSDLLAFWLRRMDEADVPLSDLGGDRLRYNHFGWERSGREIVFDIADRALPNEFSREAIRPATTESDDLRELRRLYRNSHPGVRRDRETARRMYGQRGIETLRYHGSAGDAYVCLTCERSRRDVLEFGGSAEGIRSVLAFVLAEYDVESIRVYAPDQHPLATMLEGLSSSWTVQPHRMYNVRDLHAVVSAFEGEIARRWTTLAPPRSGTLSLRIRDQPSGVVLRYSPDSIAIEPFEGTPDVELDRLAMTRLLFGTIAQPRDRTFAAHVLRRIFPLNPYIWRTERV